MDYEQVEELATGTKFMMAWTVYGDNQEDVTNYELQVVKTEGGFTMLTGRQWREGQKPPPFKAALPKLSTSYNEDGELQWMYEVPDLPLPDEATYTLIDKSSETPERPPKRKRDVRYRLKV